MEKHEISEKIKGLEVKKKRTEAELGVVYEKAGDIIEDIGEGKYSKKVQGEQKPIPSVARVMEKSPVLGFRCVTPRARIPPGNRGRPGPDGRRRSVPHRIVRRVGQAVLVQ